MSDLAVVYRPIAALIPYARNARTHSEAQVEQIAASRRGGRKKGSPNKRTMLVDAVLQKTADKYTQRVISQGIPNRVQRTSEQYAEISDEGDAIDFLTRIYGSVKMPLIIRIDCAKVVAPFERPRLTAIANRDRKDMQQPFLPPEG